MSYVIINKEKYTNVKENASPNSLKFTGNSRENIGKKALLTDELSEEELNGVKAGFPNAAIAVEDSKKLKLPNKTFNTVKNYNGSNVNNNVVIVNGFPNLEVVELEEPKAAAEPTIEESKAEEKKLNSDLWKTPELEVAELRNAKSEPSLEEPKAAEGESKLWRAPEPEDLDPKREWKDASSEKKFEPQNVPSIAVGLEETDEAQKIREALKERIAYEVAKAKAEAEERAQKAEREAIENRKNAEEEKRRREYIDEELSKTRSDYEHLVTKLNEINERTREIERENNAYKKVFEEITTPTKEDEISR